MERPPLVLLPGLLCDARLWRDQADDLADVTSPIVADLTRDDSIAAMARRVLDDAPHFFALAALSMGGYVAFEILRQAPERVVRLALLDTTAAPDDAERAAERRAGIASLAVGKFAGVTRRLLPRLVHPRHAEGPVGREVREMALRVGGDAYVRQQQAILGRPDSRPMLARIAVPTLVAVGDQDAITPMPEALEIHRGIAGSRFHVFESCGHLPPLESPNETSAVLRDWLAGR
jgi:pimeloyl-ACP methyl ester carboxylesterase